MSGPRWWSGPPLDEIARNVPEHGTLKRFEWGCRCRSCVLAYGVVHKPVQRSLSRSLTRRRQKGRRKLREEGLCRLCHAPRASFADEGQASPPGARRLTRHHLVPQRWFAENPEYEPYRNVDANIVPLCGPCHRLVERTTEACRRLRERLSQAEVSFVIQTRGRAWLDERYPLGADTLGADGLPDQPTPSP